jgi:hypothetical protein
LGENRDWGVVVVIFPMRGKLDLPERKEEDGKETKLLLLWYPQLRNDGEGKQKD